MPKIDLFDTEIIVGPYLTEANIMEKMYSNVYLLQAWWDAFYLRFPVWRRIIHGVRTYGETHRDTD